MIGLYKLRRGTATALARNQPTPHVVDLAVDCVPGTGPDVRLLLGPEGPGLTLTEITMDLWQAEELAKRLIVIANQARQEAGRKR